MKKHQLACFACVLVALLLQGCGTITTRADGFDQMLPKDHSLVRVYSGVLWDLNVMDPSTAIGQNPDEDPEEPYFNVLYIFDVPFSLVADTLMLPFSIYEQTVHGSYRRRGPR
ncbi:MAG: YceK/YidQ family lipoprotein [Planctomycetota bacterium]|jgi:uncharacterized protein YceK